MGSRQVPLGACRQRQRCSTFCHPLLSMPALCLPFFSLLLSGFALGASLLQLQHSLDACLLLPRGSLASPGHTRPLVSRHGSTHCGGHELRTTRLTRNDHLIIHISSSTSPHPFLRPPVFQFFLQQSPSIPPSQHSPDDLMFQVPSRTPHSMRHLVPRSLHPYHRLLSPSPSLQPHCRFHTRSSHPTCTPFFLLGQPAHPAPTALVLQPLLSYVPILCWD